MKKLISVFLVIALILSFCSCSLSSKNFNIGYLDGIDSLNPYNADGDGEKIIAANCFEGLLRFDENGEIDLAGATAYSVDSKMLKYTFSLNPEAIWRYPEGYAPDGEDYTVNSSDFIKGFEFLSEKHPDEFKGASAEAKDKLTLVFNLQEPDADFIYKLCAFGFVPFRAMPEGEKGIATNGAYFISETNEDSVILNSNDSYKGKLRVKNQEIVLKKFSTYAQLEKSFKKGKLDILLSDTFKRIDDDAFNEAAVKNNVWGVGFNFKNKQLHNKELRLLLLNTLNFGIIKTPAFAEGKATGLFFDNLLVSDKKLSDFQYTATPFEADEAFSTELDNLLKKENAEHFSFKVLVPKQLENSFQKVIAQWESIFGEKIIFTLDSYKAENSVLAIKKGNYDIAVLPLSPDGLTPAYLIEKLSAAPFYYKNDKLTGYENAAFSDIEKNISLYEKAEKLIISEGIFVPLFYSGSRLYSQSDISGFYFSPDGETLYIHSGARSV